jgi:2'-5' RNA ligase
VESSERPRLFLALPLPEEPRERLVSWQTAVFAGAAGVRVVPPENLHVTLVFLGERPVAELDAISTALHEAAAVASRPVFSVVRYRETRTVGMVVLEEEDGAAARLQADLAGRLERLGVFRPERRAWLPHVTVARFRVPPRLRPAPPALGRVSPSEAASYTSRLRRNGAQYEIRESVPLGG